MAEEMTLPKVLSEIATHLHLMWSLPVKGPGEVIFFEGAKLPRKQAVLCCFLLRAV